ncbi:hypothetical protein PRIPAC_90154 [Pristionchus pacificus]|uniref:Uncharacterized protein n=1 Tax=Pristionchus pacificus TaxID=54126 RepID=A0A2A6B8B6_PRIPA|nr:hypothetical protein PRIPAC_90154 [Pristionchus pacificus]|eukprot:PDM62107.1 hypothetical protein PRIPAC_51549 [Pristionchus pacificus]
MAKYRSQIVALSKYAASNMCKAMRHVSDRLTAHTQNNLMSNPNAVKVVGCLDIRPIDVENTTYEAILSVLQLATADKNGAESVIQHYDQLIIVSMTRPIDSPKDKRKRDIDTKIGFWKRVGKSGAREKEECSIM